MAAKIIDGTAISAAVRERVKQRVAQLKAKGKSVRLVAILIGATPAAEMYAQRQGQACQQVGIEYELVKLPETITQAAAEAKLEELNRDVAVTGIMLHMPVPKQLSDSTLQQRIAPAKDVEGVNPTNLGLIVSGEPLNVPCTAKAAFELIKTTGVPMRGAEAVVVGASEIVGKPVALFLSDERATVQICRSATPDLAGHCRKADILVAAVGKAGIIGGDFVKDGAVVIDVGINRVTLPDGTKKTVGDVDYEAAKEKAGWITPVPGGVGPMTVAMLLENTVIPTSITTAPSFTKSPPMIPALPTAATRIS
ncbi:MAG TPA: bifunctional 5,10-methylenetetrahydrofolate dehydrogenase/5,10-methenyltetrahydrofolate cyclohydrolase, partial [Tepidisphaeraceae bacterium]|nr:bifunctional 5,10-methylenetetrahydrofolate dehydrogenase/5,10-methenyltetrahydrofolate cyclohydrolase [Tepidisphaeraceae bacterium]